MKARLLLTSALFLFVQISTMQAQVTVDVSKITCEQVLMEKLAWTEREVELWLSGYYHGKRNDTIVEPEAVKQNEEKLNRYCYEHRDTTVMDAVKNVLGRRTARLFRRDSSSHAIGASKQLFVRRSQVFIDRT